MKPMDGDGLLGWLREEDPDKIESLWEWANTVRRRTVGDEVHLRGLIEISSFCRRRCLYCGLRADNSLIERYRMSRREILESARHAQRLQFGTVVLQGGEDPGCSADWVASVIRELKKESSLAVTLSLGERSYGELALWREAGADRYFLRFETSDAALYRRIHPSLPSIPSDRLSILRSLRGLGYEIGSGVMIGIPGQSYRSLVEDILLFRSLDLDMIGVGPFLPHPATPLGTSPRQFSRTDGEQVPATELMVTKVIALSRIFCPEANIPSTTALATLNPERGYELGLERGANVVMPNLTPHPYRSRYEIYPKKAGTGRTSFDAGEIRDRIRSMGRTVGKGPGKRSPGCLRVPGSKILMGVEQFGEQP
ncbi:MAG TPA: [FeFe] hydrogenase H-cluster radical SAM maturase HydE [Syntrophobacteraceae bacterium]|nr:[FeFe] hydrogenase H-cluster radical SAM maturase HydE [Syntrophobacteraceae bacterium]